VAIGVIIDQSDNAEGKGARFDHSIESSAIRLELVKNDNGTESIRWHGIVDGAPEIFHVDPYTGFWRRLGIGIMGLLPIESQL
jgi:putative cardiolipin synthase